MGEALKKIREDVIKQSWVPDCFRGKFKITRKKNGMIVIGKKKKKENNNDSI